MVSGIRSLSAIGEGDHGATVIYPDLITVLLSSMHKVPMSMRLPRAIRVHSCLPRNHV